MILGARARRASVAISPAPFRGVLRCRSSAALDERCPGTPRTGTARSRSARAVPLQPNAVGETRRRAVPRLLVPGAGGRLPAASATSIQVRGEGQPMNPERGPMLIVSADWTASLGIANASARSRSAKGRDRDRQTRAGALTTTPAGGVAEKGSSSSSGSQEPDLAWVPKRAPGR
jgi:hypothetical protein